MIRSELFAKYDIPVPRYTSYPTVPQWHTQPTPEQWADSIARTLAQPDPSLAVYVHLPFCESLCTYCGCNTVITRDHSRSAPYVDLVLMELDAYVQAVPALARQAVRQLHLGGGTPTFLSTTELNKLIDGIFARLPVRDRGFEGSVEVDPRVTTTEQLESMAARGFQRISLGVQDVDPEVQNLVNRHQPVEMTAKLCSEARRLNYESINLDLIYGLPAQTVDSMARLVKEVIAIKPGRLAVYSFARVPWIKPQQRKFRDDQIPVGAEKRALYEAVREPLLEAGYVELGLDHFALPTDALAQAAEAGRLHRNFMGYTDVRTTSVLGLGVSAISETLDCYHQNEKVLPVYDRRVRAGEIPTLRGHLLSDEDRRRRAKIFDLMTKFDVHLTAREAADAPQALDALVHDGLVSVHGDSLTVPADGRPFLRNVATFFDEYYGHEHTKGPTYSTSA